jgi:hypothetical protein
VTSVRDQRDDFDEEALRLRRDRVWLSAPPLNAANDNERDLRFGLEDWGSIVTSESSVRASSRGSVLVAVCAATAAIAMGWMFIISLTLLDSVNSVLSFLGK